MSFRIRKINIKDDIYYPQNMNVAHVIIPPY